MRKKATYKIRSQWRLKFFLLSLNSLIPKILFHPIKPVNSYWLGGRLQIFLAPLFFYFFLLEWFFCCHDGMVGGYDVFVVVMQRMMCEYAKHWACGGVYLRIWPYIWVSVMLYIVIYIIGCVIYSDIPYIQIWYALFENMSDENLWMMYSDIDDIHHGVHCPKMC